MKMSNLYDKIKEGNTKIFVKWLISVNLKYNCEIEILQYPLKIGLEE